MKVTMVPAFRRLIALVVISLIAAPQLLAAVSPELPDPGNVPGVTKEQQEQLGRQVVAEVYKQMPVMPDSHPISRYVQQLGARLTSVIPQQYSWPYEFHVVQQKDINAFALPGGPVFINLGTIMAAQNEAELAGVMAHEISHVYMQHSMKQQRKAALPSLLGGLAAAAAGMIGGTAGALGQVGAQIAAGSVIMKYSRTDETQADSVGAIIMYKSGYNPQAMADFFKTLEQEGGGSPPQFLSDHPNPGNREAAIQREIQPWPSRNWRGTSTQFQTAKSNASSVKAYSAEEIAAKNKSGGGWNNQQPQPTSGTAGSSAGGSQGAVVSPVSVSSSWKPLQHQAFTIQYPDNWQPYGSSQAAVSIAPQGGLTQSGLAYGAMIDSFQSQNANASVSQQTQELITTIQQQNPGLRAAGQAQSVTVNGVRGRSVSLTGNSPLESNGSPVRERDWLVALPQGDGTLLYVVFVAPDRDFAKLKPTFERMLRTFRLQ